MEYESIFNKYKEESLRGRYITLDHIEQALKGIPSSKLDVIGHSCEQRPIYAVTIGSGPKKILMWSQMHGNESTATKALFDIFNLLSDGSELSRMLRLSFTFCFVPMLNPDGAFRYTRENAAEVDLNRDFVALSQPETKALKALFDNFKPDFCYNLHDQRTIFGVGDTGKSATVSFLSPSFNEAREWNANRKAAVAVIKAMNSVLQKSIPGQVGRFDDSFNINCAGDSFQFAGVPTILIEAGHFDRDYEREVTRYYLFIALLSGLVYITENDIVGNGIDEYLNIPQNKKVFYDIVYKNIKFNYDGNEIITNFAVQFSEVLIGNRIDFIGKIAAIGNLDGFFGHIEYDGYKGLFRSDSGHNPIIDKRADFYIGNVKFENGMPQS